MHPDVEIADWLSDRYPDEMTVVVQHWFDNLEVTDEGFSITLNFGDSPEPLYIPFMALRKFVDPSVEFGLRFEQSESAEPQDADIETLPVAEAPIHANAEPSAKPKPEAEVGRLDSFRIPSNPE